MTRATSVTLAPTNALTTGTPTSGGSVDTGSHDYVVTYVTSIGETAVSPISLAQTAGGTVTTGTVSAPSTSPSLAMFDAVSTFAIGDSVSVAVTYRNANGETTAGPWSSPITVIESAVSPGNAQTVNLTSIPVSADPSVTSKRIYIRVNGSSTGHTTATAATTSTTVTGIGSAPPTAPPGSNTATTTALARTIPLNDIPVGGSDVTSRKLYRRFNASGTFKLLATIADNTTTVYSDTTANASLGADAPSSNTAYLQRIPLTAIPLGASLVTQRKIYRTVAGGSQLKLAHTLADNTTTTWTDTVTDASLGVNVPVANTATANRVSVSGIPIGGTGVTQRKLYRTATGASQLKLLTTIADNTTTTYADSTADASLGANAPGSDASGLAQPEGQVAPGSTSIVVANTSAFRAAGGRAVIGNGQQVIRYTGVAATSLTGIPASGAGAITAAIAYNSTITAAPMLIGIPASGDGAILHDIVKGDAVNVSVQVDDVPAQAALALLLGYGDGIREGHIKDERLGAEECAARGQALLDQKSEAAAVLTYACRDLITDVGKTITVSLTGNTAINDAFLIQRVVIDDFQPNVYPTFKAYASTDRFDFEDLLRQIRSRS